MKKVIVAVLLSGCASVPLTPEQASVRILRKTDAPASCRELGKVIAYGLASLSDDGRESDLKRATVKLGGNTVTLDRRDENGSLFGIAYACAGDAK